MLSMFIVGLCVCQDYNWWWRSFIISGGSALYMFLYSVFYFMTKVSLFRTLSALSPLTVLPLSE